MRHRYPKRLRLQGYDYTAPGSYFVSICTHRRAMLFDNVCLREMVEEIWLSLPERFPQVKQDAWVVIPNHFHGIICLVEQADVDVARPTLSAVVGAFKSLVAVRWLAWIGEHEPERSGRIWQRGYYERIIRHDRALNAVRHYIHDNPRRWTEDRDNLDTLIGRMDARL